MGWVLSNRGTGYWRQGHAIARRIGSLRSTRCLRSDSFGILGRLTLGFEGIMGIRFKSNYKLWDGLAIGNARMPLFVII